MTWVLAAAGGAAALALVYALPLILVPGEGLDAEKRLKAENDLRTVLVQAVGGAILLVGTARTLQINREGQITERFSRAIDQLGQTGEEKLDVRLGGIYALDRIARDSKHDRGPIAQILTAFLRVHARWTPDVEIGGGGASEGSGASTSRRQLPADWQAAATVLSRGTWARGHRFNLVDVDLHDAIPSGAHLERAVLSRAHLEHADLGGAHLEGAALDVVHLEGAELHGAHLEGAFLGGAHLDGASLYDAHLEGANLGGARLEGAHMGGAHLSGTVGLPEDRVSPPAKPPSAAGPGRRLTTSGKQFSVRL